MAHDKVLEDGFSTIITLANLPSVKMFEKDVTPPGFSGGGPIDLTTMRNTAWRTSAARSLKTLSPVSSTVAYATEAIDQIKGEVQVNQQITIQYPDGSSIQFYGWVEEFTPAAHTEGEQPTASLTVQPSNRDAAGVETGPTYSAPAGS